MCSSPANTAEQSAVVKNSNSADDNYRSLSLCWVFLSNGFAGVLHAQYWQGTSYCKATNSEKLSFSAFLKLLCI
jgi:hypothetical protein